MGEVRVSNKLTIEDIDVLYDALEHWVNQHIVGDLMGMILSGIIKDADERQKFMDNEKKKREEEEPKVRGRKDRKAILQAKLLKLKDSIIVDELTKG